VATPWSDLLPRDFQLQAGEERTPDVPLTSLWLRGHRVVLVNEAAQHVVTNDVDRRGWNLDRAGGCGHAEVDPSVGPLLVVVADVLPQHPLEVPPAQDERPVQALGPHGSHPALRIGVGPRRSDGGLDHPDALGAEHLFEAGGELGVPVPDQELDGIECGQPGLLRSCGPPR